MVLNVVIYNLLRELGYQGRMDFQVMKDLAISGIHELAQDFLVFLMCICDNFMKFREDLRLFLVESLLESGDSLACFITVESRSRGHGFGWLQ